MTDSLAPAPVLRPKLATWLFERGIKPAVAARTLGVGREQARRYCLPFGDPLRAIPRQDVIQRVVDWTRGEVTPADFYAPPGFGA